MKSWWHGGGALSFCAYPDKFGIKVFELCDSNTAYCCKLDFYTGRKKNSPLGATFDIVEGLIAPHLDWGQTLYINNYYTSPILFACLKEHSTLASGTMRMNQPWKCCHN
ncbi:PiggyBac transposable element-derived protein 4-like [Plakobranchus ocellatus]|uniref:PiggyBac transposable element-derived protein 4-like n=1 Tax=Plakobranchus ocellatus TaxID=259542 RepID=A0AAV3ZJD3_9GAST|nr:PiggyBac transposable element-derived protein 4-like [Plakobranchus ocellatus]